MLLMLAVILLTLWVGFDLVIELLRTRPRTMYVYQGGRKDEDDSAA